MTPTLRDHSHTGAQTQLIDPLNRRTTSAYDAAGQQNLRIDARGNRTTYTYSTVGELTSRRYPNGTRATFSYDTVGNRTLMADSIGRYTSTYDAVGQTTSAAFPGNFRFTHTFDKLESEESFQIRPEVERHGPTKLAINCRQRSMETQNERRLGMMIRDVERGRKQTTAVAPLAPAMRRARRQCKPIGGTLSLHTGRIVMVLAMKPFNQWLL